MVIGGIGLDETTKIMPYDLSVNFTDTRQGSMDQNRLVPDQFGQGPNTSNIRLTLAVRGSLKQGTSMLNNIFRCQLKGISLFISRPDFWIRIQVYDHVRKFTIILCELYDLETESVRSAKINDPQI